MSRVIFSDGLLHHPEHKVGDVPMFFDNEHRLLEAPTQWAVAKSKIRSRSTHTRRIYGYKMNKFLNFLDEAGHGSQNWANVDEDIFDEFLLYLCERDEDETPAEHGNAAYYAYRVWGFYQWTTKQGYQHYLDLEAEDVNRKLKDQLFLAHSKSTVTVEKLNFNLPTGRPAMLHREISKFVTEEEFHTAMAVLAKDDMVYTMLAYIMGSTALRPMEVLQIPYRGRGRNQGFVDYNYDSIPGDMDSTSIAFRINSKGKVRTFQFPGQVWRMICEHYIPLRRKRSELHKKKYGRYPSNDILFLSAEGDPVTYRMIHYHFKSVPATARQMGLPYTNSVFSPKMLRHMFATYWVYRALKSTGKLGRPYTYDLTIDEELRKWMGHEDVGTTYEYYVHLVNRFAGGDLMAQLAQSNINGNTKALADALGQ
ncbi:tyrosine-type recombinase/integrase [Noviherbaspirillum pedocola]|uniref:Tyr recombinase domain-containing protein n=1 Tax=Noviherbaspirillum pedocola TaxID=2801341 RepID=A0A934W5Y3_9BURK|nr:hypothetical protein [Noviherbaspirillum pedocola]MBK4735537.1 hypothetical protein [Noviherbaspirillum pedocola]